MLSKGQDAIVCNYKGMIHEMFNGARVRVVKATPTTSGIKYTVKYYDRELNAEAVARGASYIQEQYIKAA